MQHSKWIFGLVDDWGLPVTEARAYLYNSTDSQDYSSWKLIGWGDTDVSGNVTIEGLPMSWDASSVPGKVLEYRLTVKMKIGGAASPITLGNWTIMTRGFDPNAKLKQLGAILNSSAEYSLGPYGTPPDQWGRFKVRIFYVAFKVVDERGYPLPKTEVSATFCSEYLLGSSKGTLITNRVVPAWRSSIFPLTSLVWPVPITNGSCGQEFASLQPSFSPNTAPEEFGGVGWIVVRIPSIDATSGEESSLVNNITLIFKYRETIVGNFTATSLLLPTGAAWMAGTSIDGRLDSDNHATTLNAELQGNRTQVVICSVGWVYAKLYDQNHNAWPTRAAKLTAYDVGAGGGYPWPGVVMPALPSALPNLNPSLALIRYPKVNTSVKFVVTWFGVTVNVTIFPSRRGMPGGMLIPGRPGSCDLSNPSNSELDGVGNFDLFSDMVRVRLKLLGSNELPAPLEPDEVDEIMFRLESGFLPSVTSAKLSYWHGYVALPDSPLSWYLSSSDLAWLELNEAEAATGWLPNGSRTTIDLVVKYMGVEVLDTRRSYPFNSTISLKCPGFVNGLPITDPALTDYDKTLSLYVGTCDVVFRVFLGDSRNNVSASNVPLFLVLPNGQGTMVWTDGGGAVTLRDVPEGTYGNFTILYKMVMLKASNVGPEGFEVRRGTKPSVDLLFPSFDMNLTIWNFHKTFKLVNVNVSLYISVNFSDFGITGNVLDSILSLSRSRESVLPEGWTILSMTPSDPLKCPTVLIRTSFWSTTSSWPLEIKSMPPANYSVRVSVPLGARSKKAGFRDQDSNATLYWSGDPWGEKIVLRSSLSIDIRTYVYDARVATFDASGFPLYLFENSAIIMAEPYHPAAFEGTCLRNLQQTDPERDDYNAYLVRFNSSSVNVFHSVNASKNVNDTDIIRAYLADNYPQQSRYLIGAGNLSQPEYRFIVYFRGVLVFNGSITLSNPYVSEESVIVTSTYDYVFRVLNDPFDGASFGIPDLQAQVSWAGLNTSFWPTANLTGTEAEDEFLLLNATKLQDGFDLDVVRRMWGPPADEFQLGLLPNEKVSPYFSSYLVGEGGITDSNGEIRVLIPVWNGSSRTFGTPTYFEAWTVPGVTAGVPSSSGAALVGWIDRPNTHLGDPPWSGQYPLWTETCCANLTGLVDPFSASNLGFSRSNFTGTLPGGLQQSPIIIRALANDLYVAVKDASGNCLPHQRVEIYSQALSLQFSFYTGGGPTALKANKSFILWGAYDYYITTTNLTDPDLYSAWQLYGLQQLYTTLNPIWTSQVLVLQWPAQLIVQVFAGDGCTPLEKAWVLISYGTNLAIDANSGSAMEVAVGTNVTASLTDSRGFAGGFVPITTKGGLVLGLNLFKGTYLIRVYYSVRGSPNILQAVNGILVYDSFTDQPQHRYVYLGTEPPLDSGEDWSPAQFRIVQTKVWRLKVRLLGDSNIPLVGARVRMVHLGKAYDFDPIKDGISSTTEDGSAWLDLVPGGMHDIEVEWMSPFCKKPTVVLRTSVNVRGDTLETLHALVHDIKIKLVDASGNPIAGSRVQMEAAENGRMQNIGTTDDLGQVQVNQVPSGTYIVKAYWHGEDISPDALVVTASREYVLAAKNVGNLVIQALGAMGQGLPSSNVEIWKGGERVLSGITNSQGFSSFLLPYGEYVVKVTHGGLEATSLVELESSSEVLQLNLGEFIVLFGVGLKPITAATFGILSIALFLLLAIMVHEYVIWRRGRLYQPFR